jgi:hypothetical protein
VKEFRLYSSTLSREGSMHTVEQAYPLTAGVYPGERERQLGPLEHTPYSSPEKIT